MATDPKSLSLGYIVFCEDMYSHLSPQKIIEIAANSSKLVEKWEDISDQERSDWTACAQRLIKSSKLVEKWKEFIDIDTES